MYYNLTYTMITYDRANLNHGTLAKVFDYKVELLKERSIIYLSFDSQCRVSD